jgi:hypothetical protein
MEVGQGPNVGCSVKGKKKCPINPITNPNTDCSQSHGNMMVKKSGLRSDRESKTPQRVTFPTINPTLPELRLNPDSPYSKSYTIVKKELERICN